MEHDVWDEDEIVHRLREGDLPAFDLLMARFYRPLLNFVVGYVDSLDAAEDVVQDLFIWLWERRATVSPSTTLQAYLYTAARHAALNAKTRQTTRRRHEAEGINRQGFVDYIQPQGSAHIEEVELTMAVERAITSLSARSREVYILGMRHGLTYREIAETLGISIPTAQTHLMRALKVLETVLRPFLMLAVLLKF
jgi:RNA polymerase sigma-70 factor (ECF subfamily)